jgi:hypothetical protein
MKGPQERRIAEYQFRRDEAFGKNGLRTIEVGEKRLVHLQALGHGTFQEREVGL